MIAAISSHKPSFYNYGRDSSKIVDLLDRPYELNPFIEKLTSEEQKDLFTHFIKTSEIDSQVIAAISLHAGVTLYYDVWLELNPPDSYVEFINKLPFSQSIKLVSRPAILKEINSGDLGVTLDFLLLKEAFRYLNPFQQIRVTLKRNPKEQAELVQTLKNSALLALFFPLLSNYEFHQFYQAQCSLGSAHVLLTLRYCTDTQFALIGSFPFIEQYLPPKSIVLQFSRDLPPERQNKLMLLHDYIREGSPARNIQRGFYSQLMGNFHPIQKVPPYLLLIANLSSDEHEYLSHYYSPWQMEYIRAFGCTENPPATEMQLIQYIDEASQKGSYFYLKKRVETELRRAKLTHKRFSELAADLLSHYAASNSVGKRVVVHVLESMYEFKGALDILFRVHTTVFRIANLLDCFFPHEDGFFEEICLKTPFQIIPLLTHLCKTSPSLFSRYAPLAISIETVSGVHPRDMSKNLMAHMIHLVDGNTQANWILHQEAPTQALFLDKIGSDTTVRIAIERMRPEAFKNLVFHLIQNQSSSLLSILRYCSDEQLALLENCSYASQLFSLKYSPQDMFQFLLKLPKKRRIQLYELHILNEGKSLKEIVEYMYYDYRSKERLFEHVPPMLIIACYISLKTGLSLAPYMNREQLKFIAFYGRRSAVLKLIAQSGNQAKHLIEGLPEHPVLHPHQLTKKELESRVEPI